MALAIVALSIFSYTLLLQIKSIKLTQDVSRLAVRDRFESVEGKVDEHYTCIKDLLEIDKATYERVKSLEFNQKLHSQQIKCIKVILWD